MYDLYGLLITSAAFEDVASTAQHHGAFLANLAQKQVFRLICLDSGSGRRPRLLLALMASPMELVKQLGSSLPWV